jgi:antibiotic biosynthesis monooxygenase (ABM) superfamily enzyme
MSNHPTNRSSDPASDPAAARPAHAVPPPTKHQLALMIWIAVFPTLTVLNLVLGDTLADLPSVLRTFVLATVAVPIVIYGMMPRLHRIRGRLISRPAA